MALFAPRNPIPFKAPIKPKKKKRLTGIAQLLKEDPTRNKEKKLKKEKEKETKIKIEKEGTEKEKEIKIKVEEGAENGELEEGEMSEEETGMGVFEDPAGVDFFQFEPKPTKWDLREMERKRKESENNKKIEELKKLWNPKEDPNTTSDAYKTLFVAKLNYETTETTLRNEFEIYGPIKKIRLVCDNEGKPRGYAFIEFDHQRDMKEAYKHADGKKIDGKRVIVDYERGRTSKSWIPRRLGGGKGNSRSSHSSSSSRDSYSSHSYSSSSSSSRRSRHSPSRSSRRSKSRDRYEEDRYRDRDRNRDRYEEKDRYSGRDDRYSDRDRYPEKEDRYGDRDRYDDKKRKSSPSSSRDSQKRRKSKSRENEPKRYK